MKRLIGFLLSLALITGALAGCADTTGESNTGASGESTSAITEPGTPDASGDLEAVWPRTYVDATGAKVVIEKQPERIALTHFNAFESFYALGVTPVAVITAESFIGRMSTLESLLDAGIVDLGNPLNLEKLVEAQPDLIIDTGNQSEIREELEKIAPVVVPAIAFADDPDGALREYAKILGKEAEAEQFIEKKQANLAEARGKLAAIDETAMIIDSNGKTISIYGLAVSTPFYTEDGLHLKAPEGLPNVWYEESSLEALAGFNPDHIFVRSEQEEYDQAIAELSKSLVWNSLTAVKNGQVYRLEESLFVSGPLGVQQLADYVIERLLK